MPDLPPPPKPPVSLSPPPSTLEKPRTYRRVLLVVIVILLLLLVLAGLVMFARVIHIKQAVHLFFPSVSPVTQTATPSATPEASPQSSGDQPSLSSGNSLEEIQHDLDATRVDDVNAATIDLDQEIKTAQ